MLSWILTALYLAKDTLHRWCTRISSPLARVLVVFFLSLCALFFLGNYVISTKIIRHQILRQGGDLVVVTMMASDDHPVSLPNRAEIDTILGADSYALNRIGFATAGDRLSIALFSYDFARSSQFAELLSPSGGPVLLTPAGNTRIPAGPCTISIGGRNGIEQDIYVRRLPDDHMLLRILGGAGIIAPPDSLAGMPDTKPRSISLVARIRDLQSAEPIRRAEAYFDKYFRLEECDGHVITAAKLLEQMDIVLSNQMQCRLAFCGGIAGIVGILLTALAGMEYRQNEYIYTLMKSFGIHPLMLVLAYMIENTLLVGAAFGAAVWVFMQFQGIILTQFFKLGQFTLSLGEIRMEMQLICASLALCILISTIPILVAANREIGRVLK